MARTYYTVLTTYGSQLFAQAMANRQPVSITQFAVGDGNGRAVQPDSARTSLVRQVHRANISAVSPDPRNNKQVIFELTIPENVGGFWIREMGIYDANNRLVAYANCPDTYKPQLSEGSGKVQVMRMILLVSSSQAVTLTVDDTVIFATRGQLTPKTITATSQNGVDDTGHSHTIDHATTGQKGIVQLTNDTGLDSEALALTAKAGKKLAQEIAQNRQKTVELANQKVNKSDVSDAVNSTSQTTVASSRGLKTAYDKGVEAKTAADNARAFAAEKATDLENRKLDKLVQQTLDLTRLDPNKWYPVILKMPNVRKLYQFAVRRTLGDGNNPTWATHGDGFSTYCEWETQPSQWGAYPYIDPMRLIRQFTFAYCHQSPMLKIGQINQASWEYIYLRGGTSYTLSRESDVIVDIGVNGYVWQYSSYSANLPIIESYDESLVPKTNRQALQDAINTKANQTTTLAGYGITDFVVTTYRGDLNTLRVDGIYSINSYADAQNMPVSSSGHVIVICGGASNQRWCRQIYKPHYSGTTYERWQTSNTDDEWSEWVRTDGVDWVNIRNKPVVSRRDYSRRINGTAAGQTHNQMDVVGSVHIHPDGRIVQILHLKHFRDFWFELEDASVGYGEGIRGIQVNLQLWTAMPNKILSVQPQLIRATHPTSSVVYGQGEAAEHICAWDLRKQGNSRDRVIVDMSRFRGGASEHIDMYVVVEGY